MLSWPTLRKLSRDYRIWQTEDCLHYRKAIAKITLFCKFIYKSMVKAWV